MLRPTNRNRNTRRRGQFALRLAICWIAVSASATDKPLRTVVDELGRTVQVPIPIERIVSMAPSLTEIIFALGLGDRLVGVSNFCDYPPEAKTKPRIGPPMNPSLERIVELRPDVVLGSSTANHGPHVEELERLGVPVFGTNDPRTVQDIFASIHHLAELTGTEDRADVLVAQLAEGLRAVEARVAGRRKPTALLVIWIEPLITSGRGTFLHDVLEHAGAVSVTADIKQQWPRLSLEEVIERDPDYLILSASHELQERFERMKSEGFWSRVRAVRENRVIWLDESLLRPVPRIVDVIEKLAKELHAKETPAQGTVQ